MDLVIRETRRHAKQETTGNWSSITSCRVIFVRKKQDEKRWCRDDSSPLRFSSPLLLLLMSSSLFQSYYTRLEILVNKLTQIVYLKWCDSNVFNFKDKECKLLSFLAVVGHLTQELKSLPLLGDLLSFIAKRPSFPCKRESLLLTNFHESLLSRQFIKQIFDSTENSIEQVIILHFEALIMQFLSNVV